MQITQVQVQDDPMNTATPQLEEHPVTAEEHKVAGDKLLAKVRQIIHQGNVRRIIVKTDEGVTLMEVPLTVGVVGAVLLPVWVALGAIAAVAAHYRIVVEKMDEKAGPAAPARDYAFVARPDV
jgi:hypothetical protein